MKKTIPLLLALLVALVACGTKPAGDEAKKDEKGDMVKFAQCMRENGVDMPDPETNGEGGMVMRAVPSDGDSSKMEAAHNACKQYLRDGGEMKPPSPEEQDKMRQQAKCLRDKGHNWPDPNFDGGMQMQEGPTLDFNDEKLKQDMKDCGMGEMGAVTFDAEGK